MQKRFLKRDKIDILARLPLFEACSQRELSKVAAISVDAHRAAGTVLTWEGQVGGLMFVILEGEAELLAGGRDANQGYARPPAGDLRIATLGPGDVVGELSLIDGKPRSATVRAVTDLHVLEIASDDFRRLIDSSPTFVRNLMRSLSLRIREMDERWPAEL